METWRRILANHGVGGTDGVALRDERRVTGDVVVTLDGYHVVDLIGEEGKWAVVIGDADVGKPAESIEQSFAVAVREAVEYRRHCCWRGDDTTDADRRREDELDTSEPLAVRCADRFERGN
jgi:hypothetical protein